MKSSGLTDTIHTSGLTGSCLCGGVSYSISGEIRQVVNCFCTQCQKTTGNFVAATRIEKSRLELHESGTLSWFQSSQSARRGFCNRCGGNLFWENAQSEQISIMAGTIDQPTGLKTTLNIYTADASDFHLIPELPNIE